MQKLGLLKEISERFRRGENIIRFLRSLEGRENNSLEDVLIAYDFQAGSYLKRHWENQQRREVYGAQIAAVINQLGKFDSIIEVGLGEGTTLAYVLKFLNSMPEEVLGFDISWSRVKYAKAFLEDSGYDDLAIFTGDLFNCPLPDHSLDIVYTAHTIEPNGGREIEALQELYRITKKYLVLIEPSYEFATEEGKQRMISSGYATKLYTSAQQLGYKILEHRIFDDTTLPMNPSGLLVIEKEPGNTAENTLELVCPWTKTALIKESDSYFTKEGFLAYPVIQGIPCLLKDNAIVATHYLNSYKALKGDR